MTRKEHEGTNTNSLNVEIITPTSSFEFKDAHMVVMPGAKGEFGALPGHVPLISALASGVVTVFQGNHMKVVGRVNISSGFVEVTGKTVVILVEQAEDAGHHH